MAVQRKKPKAASKKKAKSTRTRAKTKKTGAVGRPRIEIDWEMMRLYAMAHCTLEEVAFFFNCSEDTIERACKREQKMSFADFFRTHRAGGKISVRRALFQMAHKVPRTMEFWCINHLGMTNKPDSAVGDQEEAQIVIFKYPDNGRGPDE